MSTAARNAEIMRLRMEGVGPREIARRLTISPNIVAGVLTRAGLSGNPDAPAIVSRTNIPPFRRPRKQRPPSERAILARKLYLRGLKLKDIAAVVGCNLGSVPVYVRELPRRREITWATERKPDSARLEALTALASGETWRSVGERLGHNARSMMLWRQKSPEMWARAQLLAAPIIAERKAREAAALAEIDRAAAERRIEAAVERARIDQLNAPLMADIQPRHRAMLEMRIDGASLQDVGTAFDVTRERVRQIEVRYRLAGLIVPGTRSLTPAAQKFKAPERPYERRLTWTDAWAEAHDILDGIAHRRIRGPYNISDEERERRREHMRAVATRRWTSREASA